MPMLALREAVTIVLRCLPDIPNYPGDADVQSMNA
jgi:hypothetical protein